jgi:hypothetical protein
MGCIDLHSLSWFAVQSAGNVLNGVPVPCNGGSDNSLGCVIQRLAAINALFLVLVVLQSAA